MTRDQWTAVEEYLNGVLIPADAALDAALQRRVIQQVGGVLLTARRADLLER